MIIPQIETVFVHSSKCGGTSVESVLLKHFAGDGVPIKNISHDIRQTYQVYTTDSAQHYTAREILDKRPETSRYNWFTITRHPVQRFISEFYYQKGQYRNDSRYARLGINGAAATGLVMRQGYAKHHYSQKRMLEGAPVQLRRFRLEDQMQELNAYLNALVGVDLLLPHKNKSQREDVRLTPAIIGAVENAWSEDYEFLGYERLRPDA